jgi:hypothetical protein
MESFLVPALILLVVVAGVLVVVKLSRKRSGGLAGADAPGRTKADGAPTREAAIAASGRLDQQQHTAVYSMIARGHGLEAIQAYRKATGAGLREAAAAVANMSAYPQPYAFPEFPQAPEAAEPGPAAAEPFPAEPELPQEPAPAAGNTGARWIAEEKPATGAAAEEQSAEPAAPARPAASTGETAAPGTADAPGQPSPGPFPAATGARSAHRAPAYRYRAIVSKGDEIREIASTRLNDEVYTRIRETALAGELEAAARLLMEHSDAGEQEALEFVALISPDEG